MILGFTVFASAQYRDQRGKRGYNNRDITSSVTHLRNHSREFEQTLDRELDRSRYDGSRTEDNLNRLANRFKKAAEDLKNQYKGNRKHEKGADEARRLLDIASQLDRALSASRLSRRNYLIMNSWAEMERDLATISQAYNYNYHGSYGRNRGNNDRYGRDDDRYGRNDDRSGRDDDRYPRDNRRTNGRYDRNLSSTISNLKYKARSFEDRLDQDRYDRNGSNLERLSDRFKNAVDDLADEYDENRGTNSGYNEAEKVLRIGEQLDREISNSRVGRAVKSDWSSIEGDLKTLANAYNKSYSGNNGRFGGLGDIFRDFPF